MKRLLLFVSLVQVLALAHVNAAEDTVVFRAILDMGDSPRFSLCDQGGANSRWVQTGDVFLGWELTSYDPETKTLTLTKDGQTQPLSLSGDTSGAPTKGTYADAEAVFEAMQFDELLQSMLDQQEKAMADMQRKIMEQQAGGQPIDEELLAIQQEAVAEVFDSIDWKAMKDGMIGIYADTFTKDELNGMTAFYSTPAGRAMIEKQPEVQQRTMEVMMPQMMELMPKIQESTKQKLNAYYAKKNSGE